MQNTISAFFKVKNESEKKMNVNEKKMNVNKKKKEKNNELIHVYTDGSCINNGKKNARAGWGVYIPSTTSRSSHIKLNGIINGKQTNQVAELTALIKAYEVLEKDINNNEQIIIHTDSIYGIRCCTTYGEKCEKRNWNKKKPIPNQELVKKAYYLFKNKNNIKLKHIKAHTGKQDEHSLGNEMADKLANEAIGVNSCLYDNKIYLNVPYDEKDEAKKLGTKWDKNKKKWFIFNVNKYKTEIIEKWLN